MNINKYFKHCRSVDFKRAKKKKKNEKTQHGHKSETSHKIKILSFMTVCHFGREKSDCFDAFNSNIGHF